MKVQNMSKHHCAIFAERAFERAAPRYCDFWIESGDDWEFLFAPTPFAVVSFDTTEAHVRECPDYDHDCAREGCGTSWSTGGEIGVALYDATGRCWREAGVIVGGGIGG